MGMAASQARLLSITTRLTNNEFRSQMVANSKMRLANETQAASDEYMEALNATKLQYVYYDANGEQTQYDLTASTILQYQPLKNQYALVNRAGQTMVNHNDATTFQQANNRDEFLVLNNCAEMVDREVVDPKWLEDWNAREPDPSDYTTTTSSTDSELYNKFITASSSCHTAAMNGTPRCYLHVLMHILDYKHNPEATGDPWCVTDGYPKTLYTSLGDTITINLDSGTDGKYITYAGMHNKTNSEMISEVSDALTNGWKGETVMAVDPGNYDGSSGVYYTFSTGNAKADSLLSSFKDDGTLKTLKEKAIDLYYVVNNYDEGNSLNVSYDDLKHALENFQVDMSMAFTETIFDEEAYNNAYEVWENEPPQMKTITEIKITDPDKAEWYNNLWYRMNGAVFDEEFMELAADPDFNNSDENHTKYFDKVAEADQSWVEFDEVLINSPEWLQFALESGELTLEKVVFNEDYDTTTELENKTWQATTWSSTADIIEVTDELAITKAEVKYEQALRDIQAKDKEYDNDIKKLDTEHNALQTEYDSIKSVLDKNMERSFKAFS